MVEHLNGNQEFPGSNPSFIPDLLKDYVIPIVSKVDGTGVTSRNFSLNKNTPGDA